jgi:TPR repeat protein
MSSCFVNHLYSPTSLISIRLWRVAARQGSLEACLRVGDFYYYGRMKKQSSVLLGDSDSDHVHEHTAAHQKIYNRKALYFAPGPYRWARYLLYPEEALGIATSWFSRTLRTLPSDLASKSTPSPELAEEQSPDSEGESITEEDREHMSIAAQYYRKAAEDHKSARANFNLGFMYEWGLGLNQDFPLAKRHYDLAREEADLAASLALYAMGIHEKALKGWMYFSSKYLIKNK